MKFHETRIRLEKKDHERLRRAAAYGMVSMSELAKRATMERVAAFEAEFERRILDQGVTGQKAVDSHIDSHDAQKVDEG